MLPVVEVAVSSDFMPVKSNLPASKPALLASDIRESVLGVVCNPDTDIRELVLGAALSRVAGNELSTAAAANTLLVDSKESELAADVSREVDTDDIKLLDETTDVMRLVLARLRLADDDDITALPAAATSAVLASSMSRSLSSLR